MVRLGLTVWSLGIRMLRSLWHPWRSVRHVVSGDAIFHDVRVRRRSGHFRRGLRRKARADVVVVFKCSVGEVVPQVLSPVTNHPALFLAQTPARSASTPTSPKWPVI
jgi:hypothetical protein